MRKADFTKKFLTYLLALAFGLYIVFPLFIQFVTSFQTEKSLAALSWPTWSPLPRSWSLFNYSKIFISPLFINCIWNSIKISIVCMALSVTISSFSGYAFSKLRFKYKNNLYVLILFFRMIPGMAMAIPYFIMARQLNMYDNTAFVGLTVATGILPFLIWLSKGYFDLVPIELEEAAMVDGCTRIGAFLRITLPLTVTGMAVVGVFSFISAWGAFLYPLLLTGLKAKPVIVLIAPLAGAGATVDIPILAAQGMVAVIPVLILAFVFQKFLLKGLTAGALKR